MRLRGFFLRALCLALLLAVPLVAGAAESPCASCHSEASTCWDCHAVNPYGPSNIDPSTGVPQVAHRSSTDLAGGNFSYIIGAKTRLTGTAKTAGHNVKDTFGKGEGGPDDNFGGGGPPGDQHSTGITSANFTCAGTFGCHGDRSIADEYEALRDAHHESTSVLRFGSVNLSAQGLTVGTSYRYLLGVKGVEEDQWMGNLPGPARHNEYYGASTMGESSATRPAGNTMSGFCAECHGLFHGAGPGETGGSSPWKRHPSDIVLPNYGEYRDYGHRSLGPREYSIQVPVARQGILNSLAAPMATVSPGVDVVMCLSCHYAHAGPYERLLRWDYTGMVAGTSGSTAGTGCFVCHTTKDR